SPIKRLFLEKKVPVNQVAVSTITEADVIIVGPGDLFTSLLSNFIFPGIVTAYKKSSAKKVLIMNLMNSTGQADSFTTRDYVAMFCNYLGRKPFDFIICNNKKIPFGLKKYYAEHGEEELTDDLQPNSSYTLVREDLLSTHIYAKEKYDGASRGLVRHDEEKLASCLLTHVLQ
ncbi:MAG: 2-phospho-L-lactate transferase CofD family protein, partial [Patescibacteria group bacterium]